MAVEAKRGCGYRKQGGLYLVSGGAGVPCDRLPIPLTVCPVCSCGFKQARGWTWTDVFGLVGGVHDECKDEFVPCPLCSDPKSIGKAGLLWIGEKFYKTPDEFQREGVALGFSRRIKSLPRGFKVGETWVLLAHSRTIATQEPKVNEGELVLPGQFETVYKPGIFTLWRPTRVEKILPESKRDSEEVKALLEQGITPVFVPDDDKDHQGSVYDKEAEEETDPELANA
jgi:hypothetical protein